MSQPKIRSPKLWHFFPWNIYTVSLPFVKNAVLRERSLKNNWSTVVLCFTRIISNSCPLHMGERCRQSCQDSSWNKGWTVAGCSGELLSNISSMRRSVSSPDDTLKRELKIQCAAEYLWRALRCFIGWWNTVLNASYYFSNKMILEGEIKDAKLSSFSSDFRTHIKHWFPLYFLYELLMSLRSAIRDNKMACII